MPYLIALLIMLQSAGAASATAATPPNPTSARPAIDLRLYPPSIEPPAWVHLGGKRAPQEARTSPRLRRGIIGGLIGAVAGVATCTLISNAFFNEGGGFSTCTAKGNLIFAGGGLALGFAIGWLTGGAHE